MKWIRKGRRYNAKEVLPKVKSFNGKGVSRADFDGDWINIRTPPLYTFKKCGIICACCGLKGEYFIKERPINEKRKHYNLRLYGVKHGKEILLTSDHVLPINQGGSRWGLYNRQTLCVVCNRIKSDEMIQNSELFIKVIDKQLEKEMNKLKYSRGLK